MSPAWSLFCVCLWWWTALGGIPLRVNSEVSIDETHPKTVKECRVHIEKALEEYWDKTEPNTDPTSSNSNLLPNSEKANYDNKEENCEENRNCNNEASGGNPGQGDHIAQDDDDDDDSSESLEDPPKDSQGHDNIQNSNSDTLDSGISESSQSVESQVESPKEVENSHLPDTKEDEKSQSDKSADDKSPIGEVQQETRRVYVVKNLYKEPIEFDDLKSDNKGEADKEKDAASGTEDKDGDEGNVDDEDDDDDAEDDDEDEDDDNMEVAANDEVVTKNNTEAEGKEVESVNDVSNEEDAEDDDDDDEEVVDEEESLPKVSVSEASKINGTLDSDISSSQSEAQVNTSKVTEETKIPEPEIIPSVVSQTIVESSNLATESLDVSKKPQSDMPKIEIKNETAPELAAKEELIENIYEDEDDDDEDGLTYRNRDHIDVILGLDEVGTELEKEEEKLAQTIFKDIKKIELSHIRPMELLYKFADSTTRSLGDAEIFNKPMLLFLGPWNSGKTSVINYILGIERTPSALETGTGITDNGFTVLTHGPQRRVISGTELATDWRYSGVQRFGQGFLDHFKSIHIPHALLQKVTIVDSPGILENKKTGDRGYSLNDAFQWFIDRADAIYVVLDPNKVDIGSELGQVIDQLKGREVRFVLNKADSIRRSDLMRVVGQLFWNLSPLMSSSEAPVIYAVSLTTHPYHPSAPTRFLDDQEKNLFYDMRSTLDRRVENRILYARKHAVKVRNHAKMVDCYLATFYRHKSIFSNKRNVAKQIVDNPRDYSIYDGLSSMTNVSRYDLPNPVTYKDFFRTHPLYDFKPLASTCSYFRGCPMDKLDEAIAKDIPELLTRYKKAKMAMQEVPEGKR